MRAFYHLDQALHRPLQSLRRGRVVAAHDGPERTDQLLSALERCGISPETPSFEDVPLNLVHAPDYLHFLQAAWNDWCRLPDKGPEVWPGYFPYWCGSPGQGSRGPCPADSILGRAGWYLGDLSAPLGPATWRSALASAASAATAVVAGESVAYALCRPSGHHARTDRASGACYLNNAAIAAACLRRDGAARVAILDVDVHHGDGIEQVFYARSDVLTVSVHADPRQAYPFYTGFADANGHGCGVGFNHNLPLPLGAGWSIYSEALDSALECIGRFRADALVVALGFDTHVADPVKLMTLETADFAHISKAVHRVGLPMVIVQEGGYAIDAISDCLVSFLESC